jgi:hypothetical protein
MNTGGSTAHSFLIDASSVVNSESYVFNTISMKSKMSIKFFVARWVQW